MEDLPPRPPSAPRVQATRSPLPQDDVPAQAPSPQCGYAQAAYEQPLLTPEPPRSSSRYAMPMPSTTWRDRVVLKTLSLMLQHRALCFVLILATAAAGAVVTL